jgi:2,3-bisphosphoglycerate-independent phosphoglycerate mutase
MTPGSDVTNMGILGFDPLKYYKGRGAIEAASLGIPMETRDAAFRTNLVATDGEKMIDSSAGHISTEEARELIAAVDEKLSTNVIKFYPGVSYRHIMIWRGGSDNVHCTAPYKIHGEQIKDRFPEGDGDSKLRSLIEDSYEILDKHPANVRRRDEGHLPANMIWFWGESRMPDIPSYFSQYGLQGAVVAAVDLIKGIGQMVGLKVFDVPGVTPASGTWSAVAMAAKATGKHVNSTTTTTISQTWLASQTGASASAIVSRCSGLRGPRARRSQTPPPKSAPPSSA